MKPLVHGLIVMGVCGSTFNSPSMTSISLRMDSDSQVRGDQEARKRKQMMEQVLMTSGFMRSYSRHTTIQDRR